MPASNQRAIDKARSLNADAYIFDLEDAVAPEQKQQARANVCAALAPEALAQAGFGGAEIIIRINALNSPWGQDDLIAACAAGPDAVLIPKVSTPGDIMRAAKDMREHKAADHTALWAMIETPHAILNIDSIVRTAADPASRLSALVIGTNDLAKDTRARLIKGRLPMLAWLSMCVVAARAYGVDCLDGVFGSIDDSDGLLSECEQGRDLGMDGKTLIHPSQIDICNKVFSPDPADVAWAKKIISAFDAPENAGKGALSLDGRMIERLHADMARRTLTLQQAIEAKQQMRSSATTQTA
jgi:citrate lyase subunit beta/citryl-CoA lyase